MVFQSAPAAIISPLERCYLKNLHFKTSNEIFNLEEQVAAVH